MNDPSKLNVVVAWAKSIGAPPDYARFVGHGLGIEQFYTCARVLWPSFRERHDCIFLDWKFEEKGVDKWYEILDKNKTDVEKMVNHIHLWDFFGGDEMDAKLVADVAIILQKTWLKSALEFRPELKMCVDFTNDDSDYGPTITLFADR